MNWKISFVPKESDTKNRHLEIISAIAKNRGIHKSRWKDFISPPHPHKIGLKNSGVKIKEADKAISLINKYNNPDFPIVVFGDYDADGITSTAIIWETLTALGIKSMPFIPNRAKHGYGLSIAGLKEVIKTHNPKLIITVDNGVTAIEETEWAQKRGIKIVIIDHHELTEQTHPADALVHTVQLAAAGLSWMFADYLIHKFDKQKTVSPALELAAIGTVADQVPLIGPNRSIAKHGIEALRKSKRLGILSLSSASGLNQANLTTYNIGYHLAPRLNAKGRLEEAIDSLRLLCTNNVIKAEELTKTLSAANSKRQDLTVQLTEKAKSLINDKNLPSAIILADENFHEGIIGLIAGKMVQEFWRPSIILNRQKKFSKGSGRSIPGFNLIEALRQTEHLLEGVGGHPMAAGFTIKTENIPEFSRTFNKIAAEKLSPEILSRNLAIDAQILFSDITYELLIALEEFHPLGIGNQTPVFASEKVQIRQLKKVGKEQQHLKLSLEKGGEVFSAIGFNLGNKVEDIKIGDWVSIAFTPEINSWNGRSQIELKLRDIKFENY
ncbi:single-stranded-DNA-specific exonuclease RecJ [Candidatus Collierbacteria bacterium]|nr:single-stranded-DNA-specific exonuclease RecJ [Candidatus Collierbacteria bacterium]